MNMLHLLFFIKCVTPFLQKFSIKFNHDCLSLSINDKSVNIIKSIEITLDIFYDDLLTFSIYSFEKRIGIQINSRLGLEGTKKTFYKRILKASTVINCIRMQL